MRGSIILLILSALLRAISLVVSSLIPKLQGSIEDILVTKYGVEGAEARESPVRMWGV